MRPAHWLGWVDARPLALFRIFFGLALLSDLVDRARELRAFLTDEGILPRGVQAISWAWSVFDLVGAPRPVIFVFALGTVATLAFTVGFRTRLATVATWIFFISIHNRNRALTLGGDDLADVLLFWSMFVELGACYSLDANRRGTRLRVPAFPARLLQYVPALIYLHAARFKLLFAAPLWLHGPMLFQQMQQFGWIRPPGSWLGQYPELCAWLGDATIALEFLIPLLVLLPWWIRPSRALAVLFNVGLQVGILATMKVGVFTKVMLALSWLWVQPEWLDWLAARRRQWSAAVESSPFGPAPRPAGRAVLFAAVVLGAQYLLMAATPAIWRRIPQALVSELKWIGLDLKVSLFSNPYPIQRWEVRGHLASSEEVDVLPVAAPAAVIDDGYFASLWASLPARDIPMDGVGRYLCRQYRERSATSLQTLEVIRFSRPQWLPGESLAPEERTVVLQQRCAP